MIYAPCFHSDEDGAMLRDSGMFIALMKIDLVFVFGLL